MEKESVFDWLLFEHDKKPPKMTIEEFSIELLKFMKTISSNQSLMESKFKFVLKHVRPKKISSKILSLNFRPIFSCENSRVLLAYSRALPQKFKNSFYYNFFSMLEKPLVKTAYNFFDESSEKDIAFIAVIDNHFSSNDLKNIIGIKIKKECILSRMLDNSIYVSKSLIKTEDISFLISELAKNQMMDSFASFIHFIGCKKIFAKDYKILKELNELLDHDMFLIALCLLFGDNKNSIIRFREVLKIFNMKPKHLLSISEKYKRSFYCIRNKIESFKEFDSEFRDFMMFC